VHEAPLLPLHVPLVLPPVPLPAPLQTCPVLQVVSDVQDPPGEVLQVPESQVSPETHVWDAVQVCPSVWVPAGVVVWHVPEVHVSPEAHGWDAVHDWPAVLPVVVGEV
jgi:hypothetical protein